MIVPSMNLAEVRREYYRDAKSVARAANKIEKAVRKTMAFRLNQRGLMLKDVYSERKNRWMVLFDFRKKDCQEIYILTWYDIKGLKAAINMENDYLLVFNGHFLERYNERMMLDINIPEQRLKHFLLSCDGNFMFDSKPEFDSEDYNIFTTMNCGIGLGFRSDEDKILHFNTFLSNDMLYPNQRKLVESLKLQSRAIDERERFTKHFSLNNKKDADQR